MIPYPNIDPVIFQIPAVTVLDVTLGPFSLRWYAVSYILGIGASYAYVLGLLRNTRLWPGGWPPLDPAAVDDFLVWLVGGVILGGRLGYVLFYNLPFYADNPLNALMIWQGGMSFHGGALGVILALLIYGRTRGVDPVRIADLIGASIGICIASVRIANFINGELYGRVTDVPWAMIFPHGGPDPRHPSQLYQAALEGLTLFAVLRVLTHRHGALGRRGALTGAFLIGYGVLRTVGELFRQPDIQIGFLFLGTTMGMWLSAPMVVFGWIFWRHGSVWPKPPQAAGAKAAPGAT